MPRNKRKKYVEYFDRMNDEVDKANYDREDRKTLYLGLIAGYLAVIADALESKDGDTE